MKGPQKSPAEEATLIKAYNEFEKSSKNLIRGPEAYPLLEIQSGPKQGSWFTLTHQKEISLGRANVNSIVLEDNSVSRSHSVIHEIDGKYFVKDVGSRNGTFVNEKKIQEDFQLKHGDLIKVGIYVLRFLTEPEEEKTPFGEEEDGLDKTVMDEPLSAYPEKKEIEEKTPPHEKEEGQETERETTRREKIAVVPLPADKALVAPSVKKERRGLKNLIYFLVALILLGGIGYTFYRFYIKKRIQVVEKIPPVTPPRILPTPPSSQPPVSQPPVQPPDAQTQIPVPQTPPVAAEPLVPIFLDVSADPLQAKIFYQGKELGVTPFKTNVTVPLGSPQEVTAIYHFDELNQDFSEKKTFVVSKQDELISIRFVGSVGTLMIKSLPKDVQVYLEGTFASNQLRTQAVKLNDIVYKRPIYLPFGNYTIEMKRPERLEGSETVVDVVKYHREFPLSKEFAYYELFLTNQDLLGFPAKIKTNPAGAEVIVDSKKYGETPFEGILPLGKHRLILRKEGYHEHEQPLTMTMNTPFASEITLKTSEAGAFINKGRELLRQGQYQQAIDQLAESLKHNPSASEIAQVQLLLGQAYIKTNAYDIAIGYFDKAKMNEGFKSRADLGIAEASFGAENKDLALARVIDVMLNEQDEKIKSDAETLFHKISPLKSVLLVSTEPPGAKVSLNGQEISQPSPVVLSDLGLGSYRLTLEKEGYKRYESRFQLVISTFKPVVVKLEPLP